MAGLSHYSITPPAPKYNPHYGITTMIGAISYEITTMLGGINWKDPK